MLRAAVVSLLLLALPSRAQTDDPFWGEADVVTKDDADKVLTSWTRDRSTWTSTYCSRGACSVTHFAAHTTHTLSVDYGDGIVEEWLYDGSGEFDGIRLHVDGLTLTAHSWRGERLSAGSLGPFTLLRDDYGRSSSITGSNGVPLVQLRYDDDGYLRHFELPSQSVEVQPPDQRGLVSATLHDTFGHPVMQWSAQGGFHQEYDSGLCIDAALSRLQLDERAMKAITFRASPSLQIAVRPDGTTAFYLLSVGGNRFLFDAHGTAVAITFMLQLAGGTLWGPKPADTALAIHAQHLVTPNEVTFTADGGVEVCNGTSGAATLGAIWSERAADGREVIRYRLVGGETHLP
jgi:hypothetical protein